MKPAARSLVSPLLLFVAVAGCGGGGGAGGLPQSQSGSASFAILVPAAGPGALAMQSVEVSLMKVNGLTPPSAVSPMTMNFVKTTPGCVPAPAGALSCVARIVVPPGKNTFAVTTFSMPNRLGAQISSSVVTTTITAGRGTNCVKPSASPSVAAW